MLWGWHLRFAENVSTGATHASDSVEDAAPSYAFCRRTVERCAHADRQPAAIVLRGQHRAIETEPLQESS